MKVRYITTDMKTQSSTCCTATDKPSHLFAHNFPVAVLYPRVAKGVDEGHVDLELLQLTLDGSGGPHRSLVVGVGEQLGQLVGRAPQVLYLLLHLLRVHLKTVIILIIYLI